MAEAKITQQTLEKLTRLKPGQQEEAARLFADGKIRTVDQYGAPPKRKSKTRGGIDNAALYMESFDQAVSQVRHLIGLFQERRETYTGMLSTQQLRVLGERAAQAVAVLDGFIASLDLRPAATRDNKGTRCGNRFHQRPLKDRKNGPVCYRHRYSTDMRSGRFCYHNFSVQAI